MTSPFNASPSPLQIDADVLVIGGGLERKESRGMHQRSDAPAQSARFDLHLHSGGLDTPWVRRAPLAANAPPHAEVPACSS